MLVHKFQPKFENTDTPTVVRALLQQSGLAPNKPMN